MSDALHFKIHGTDFAEEVGILKRELRDLAGNGSNLSFDILNGRMSVHLPRFVLVYSSVAAPTAAGILYFRRARCSVP